MSKNLEELKSLKEVISEIDGCGVDSMILTGLISILEDFKKQIETLSKKVKKLEQEDSYYPTEEEVRDFKVGGTD